MSKPETIMIDDVQYVRADKAQAEPLDGKEYCTVRTYSAGVFAGYIDRKAVKDGAATVYHARRLWYWKGAASLSQLALEGVKEPDLCKFPAKVAEVDLYGIIEVIPCSTAAQQSIEGVKVWQE